MPAQQRANSGQDQDQDQGTARPAVKRVRSDQDHSKGETKRREAKRQNSHNGSDGEDGNEKGDGDEHEHEDEDWENKAPFRVNESWDGWETQWRQSCWCGKVAFVYNADPLQAKFCHCEDCQRLHGAPFQHAAIFKKDTARLDSSSQWVGFLSAHGEVHPLSNTPTPLPRKISCRACGSPLMDEGRNMLMTFPPTFEWPRTNKEVEHQNHTQEDGEGAEKGSHDAGGEGHKRNGKWKHPGLPKVFEAKCHIFYERRVVDVRDGLTKWRGHKEKSDQMGDDER